RDLTSRPLRFQVVRDYVIGLRAGRNAAGCDCHSCTAAAIRAYWRPSSAEEVEARSPHPSKIAKDGAASVEKGGPTRAGAIARQGSTTFGVSALHLTVAVEIFRFSYHTDRIAGEGARATLI